MKLHNTEKNLLPVLVVLFLINYHLYQWYDNSYVNAMQQLNAKPVEDRYEKIQSEQHYYEIYKLAKEYKNREHLVVYIQDERDDQMLDYSSTYYSNIGKDPKDQVPVYLSELGLFVMYYFYPEYIPYYTVREFANLELLPNTVIISDKDLLIPELSSIPNTSKLTKLSQIEKINGLRVNRWPAESYYLFKVQSQ